MPKTDYNKRLKILKYGTFCCEALKNGTFVAKIWILEYERRNGIFAYLTPFLIPLCSSEMGKLKFRFHLLEWVDSRGVCEDWYERFNDSGKYSGKGVCEDWYERFD